MRVFNNSITCFYMTRCVWALTLQVVEQCVAFEAKNSVVLFTQVSFGLNYQYNNNQGPHTCLLIIL